MKQTYESDLKLGERYRDNTTDVEGTLIAVHFYEHACERGTLRYLDGDYQDVLRRSHRLSSTESERRRRSRVHLHS